MSTTTFFIFSFLLLGCVVQGDQFDNAMNAALQRLDIRGAGVTFYDKNQCNEPVSRGYGRIASSNNSAPVTADTAFMIASISKTITAAAVSVLVDDGTIRLDDDICNAIPRTWKKTACRNPGFPNRKVTWRMLVTHTSSMKPFIPYVAASVGPSEFNPTCPLRDVKSFYRDILTGTTTTSVGAGEGINWYEEAQEAEGDGGMWDRNSPPGSVWEYSNFPLAYITALVEFVTGQSFEQFCQDRIFKKLGMSRTSWHREYLPRGTRTAVPVEYSRTNGFTDVGHYCYIHYGAGGIYTTANDLSKWAGAMINNAGAGVLWSARTAENVFDCLEDNCQNGMGWFLLGNADKSNFDESWMRPFHKYDWTGGGYHDGVDDGVRTFLIVLPAAGVYASAITNTGENDEDASWKMTGSLVNAPIPCRDSIPITVAPVPKPTRPPVPVPTPSPIETPEDDDYYYY